METDTEDPSAPRRKTRRERFIEVAGRRTRVILRDLRLLANCGNRSAYEYSDADVEKIFAAIERELEAARNRFKKATRKEVVDFSLE